MLTGKSVKIKFLYNISRQDCVVVTAESTKKFDFLGEYVRNYLRSQSVAQGKTLKKISELKNIVTIPSRRP
jgi:hypothetical protein